MVEVVLRSFLASRLLSRNNCCKTSNNRVSDILQEDIKHTWLDESGNILLPIAEDFASYVNIAVQLAVDGDFRHRIGELSRMFVNRFMMDTKLMAETHTNHILDIIKQSRNKPNER